MPAIYVPADWYWRAEDGRVFSSKLGAVIAESDAAFAAWTEAGGIPTVWPRDDEGAQAQAALDAVLKAAGVGADGVASVSSAQAKIALKRAGYLTAVRHVIDALGDEEVEIWFADARVWERNHPHVVAVAEAVGLSPSEVDALFRAARLIAD